MDQRFEKRAGIKDVTEWLEYPSPDYFKNYYCVFVLSKKAPEEIRTAALRESLRFFFQSLDMSQATLSDLFVFDDNGLVVDKKDPILGDDTDVIAILKLIELGDITPDPQNWYNIAYDNDGDYHIEYEINHDDEDQENSVDDLEFGEIEFSDI